MNTPVESYISLLIVGCMVALVLLLAGCDTSNWN
jgi:hypothetical protein